MPPNISDGFIDPSLDSLPAPLGPRDDLQGQRSLSRPVSAGRQPQGAFGQLVGSITTSNTLTTIEESGTAHEYQPEHATNALEPSSENIGDESHTPMPSHELPTPHSSAAGRMNPNLDTDRSRMASRALETMGKKKNSEAKFDATASMARAVESDGRAQDSLGKTQVIAAQTVSNFLVSFIKRHLDAN